MSQSTVVYPLVGRIDSSCAETVSADLTAFRAANPEGSLILDAEKLTYISSAGLRMVLRARKAEPDLRIVNASSEVYEIFEMTGFTEMIPVEKAYRRLSVDGCEVIGEGANGLVYRLDPDTIIKVYRNPDCLPDIQRERELARRAFVLGIPTAIPYDVVRVGETYGSVFELLNADSFGKLIAKDPEHLETYIALVVDLMKKIHSTEVEPDELPDMRAVALGWADFLADHLPKEQYEKLHALIAAVPDDNHMMHGDLHVKNIMLQNGETLLIDMDTLCRGNIVFEFASVYLAYVGFGEVDHNVPLRFMGLPYEMTERIWYRIVSLYFDTEDADEIRRLTDQAQVVGYTRLLRRTIRRDGNTEEGAKLIAHCKERLAQVLSRVDTLLMK